MKNWNWILINEVTFGVAFISVCFAYHFLGWPTSMHGWYEGAAWEAAHYWLPSPLHNGLGGSSFISVVTGLNLAMVKFEAFRKSVDDFNAYWKKEVDELLRKEFPAAKADDDFRKALDAQIADHVKQELEKGYQQHLVSATRWRGVALVAAIVGIVALFFQYSTGLPGMLLYLPVLGAWVSKLFCKRSFRKEIGPVIRFRAKAVSDQQNKMQPELQSDVNAVIQKASK